MAVFMIADTHFYDDNIIRCENRPFDNVEDMNKKLIINWNGNVSKHDTVFVLGDYSFGTVAQTKEITEHLNGHKILIAGNHDIMVDSIYKDVGFEQVIRYPIIYNDWYILSHEPPQYFSKNTPYAYIYGHVHSTPMYRTITRNTACVSVERWGYCPVCFDMLKEDMKGAEEK